MSELQPHDTTYTLWLRGYCAALADLYRANPEAGPMIYQACVDAGVNEHDFENVGARAQDVDAIAKASAAWKASPGMKPI